MGGDEDLAQRSGSDSFACRKVRCRERTLPARCCRCRTAPGLSVVVALSRRRLYVAWADRQLRRPPGGLPCRLGGCACTRSRLTRSLPHMISRAPPASSYVARRTMEANRRCETRPERLLRSALHRRGLRFRKDRRLRVGSRWVRPDIVFGPTRVAVFVDGCFWHRCPMHSTSPRANAAFWEAKFDRNVARDRADDLALEEAGWMVIRVWEHENARIAADLIETIVRMGRSDLSSLSATPSATACSLACSS